MSIDCSEDHYERGRRTLLDVRSSVCPSLSYLTTWKNIASPEARRRSRLPAHQQVIASSTPPSERPAKIFHAAFKELAQELTFTDNLFPLAKPDAWNGQFLLVGYLHVPDWRSQVRMRYFANCMEAVRHITSVLTMSIEHKLSFQIGIKTTEFHFFENDTISQVDQRLVKEMYKPGFTEAPLAYSSPAAFLSSYLGKVADILRRPHASAFIGLGGPHSWLAQRWGGEELVEQFMSGPSLQVTCHFRGQNDSAEDRSLGIHWDSVSSQEIEFLFGFVPADKSNPERWLYPPVAILDEACDHWSGEWSVGMEEIFRHITSQITRSPPTAVPKSRCGWIDFLRSYNRGRKAPKFIAKENHFVDAKGGLRAAGLPVNWNRQKLTSIVVPEYAIL